jgi:hypothetical protein
VDPSEADGIAIRLKRDGAAANPGPALFLKSGGRAISEV